MSSEASGCEVGGDLGEREGSLWVREHSGQQLRQEGGRVGVVYCQHSTLHLCHGHLTVGEDTAHHNAPQ